jgi:hypothetical protein
LMIEGVKQQKRGQTMRSPNSFKQVLARMKAWFGKNL